MCHEIHCSNMYKNLSIYFILAEKRTADSESSKESSLEENIGVHKQYQPPAALRENLILNKQVCLFFSAL